jgi:hypothetical protein
VLSGLSARYQTVVEDRDGALSPLREARRLFSFIERIFADGGYAGAG